LISRAISPSGPLGNVMRRIPSQLISLTSECSGSSDRGTQVAVGATASFSATTYRRSSSPAWCATGTRRRALARSGADCGAESLSHDLSHGALGDALPPAVGRTQPRAQLLRTLARVAGHAAPDDVLQRDDLCVVDDVLPRGPRAVRERRDSEGDAAVQAATIPKGRRALPIAVMAGFDTAPSVRRQLAPGKECTFAENTPGLYERVGRSVMPGFLSGFFFWAFPNEGRSSFSVLVDATVPVHSARRSAACGH
jgi:hypothetical protein